MTPHTVHLTLRVLLSTADDYAHFLAETDPDTLQRWAGDYKTGDIQEWARERIRNILDECARLHSLFANDEKLVSGVQNAARTSLEALEQIGYRFGNAPGVGITRIEG